MTIAEVRTQPRRQARYCGSSDHARAGGTRKPQRQRQSGAPDELGGFEPCSRAGAYSNASAKAVEECLKALVATATRWCSHGNVMVEAALTPLVTDLIVIKKRYDQKRSAADQKNRW